MTEERLKKLISYDPDLGLFATKGKIRGTKKKDGYIQISLDGKYYLAHRVAWLYMTGNFPPEQIDHVNGDKSDNRFINLRAASNSQNGANKGIARNNKSGYKGVCWHKHVQKWTAQIKVNWKKIHLGSFDTPEQAHEAYKKAAAYHFREFANVQEKRTN